MSRRSLLAGAAALTTREAFAFPRGGAGSGAPTQYNYSMNLAAVTPPALPVELVQVVQPWETVTDGSSVNYLTGSTTGVSAIQFLSNAAPPCTPSLTVEFLNASQPADSQCTLDTCEGPHGASYCFTLSRGSNETNGALYIFKAADNFASATILAHLGTPNVTITNGVKYIITPTVAVSGSNIALSVAVQRLSDNNWLTSSATWSATKQNALTATDSSSPLPAQGGFLVTINQSVADIAIYGATMQNAVPQLTMYLGGANPVIAEGSTYDGYLASGVTGVMGCYDGSRIILSCALWTSGGTAWACGMFKSTDGHTWTYMTGSLQNPPGGNDLIGDNGLVYWSPSTGTYAGTSAYWQAKWYNASASAGGTNYVDIDRSTDATLQAGSWSTIVSKLIPFSGEASGGYGPNLVVNPSNVLELWTGAGNNEQIYMLYSADGVTWTDGGVQLTTPFEIVADFGECRVFYVGTTRYLSAQGTTSANSSGADNDCSMLFHNVPPYYPTTPWIFDGYSVTFRPAIKWQSISVGLGCAVVVPSGDVWGFYAGQPNSAPVFAVGAQIGYAYLPGGYPAP